MVRSIYLGHKKYDYRQSNTDHTLFLKHQREKVMALIIYFDDIIIIGDNEKEIFKLQDRLAAKFEIKNLGSLKYVLGIEVARSA